MARRKSMYSSPHSYLGLHPLNVKENIIRVYRPGAESVFLEVRGEVVKAKKTNKEGIFTYIVPLDVTYRDYRIYHQNGLLAHDPYAFPPTFGETDIYLFAKGVHYRLYEVMGGRLCSHQDILGTKFAVWAPNAAKVSLVADFNFWDGRLSPMRSLGSSGIWEIFVPGIIAGEKYKFEIHTQKGNILLKSDPFALFSEHRPSTASIVFDENHFTFTDEKWIKSCIQRGKDSYPLSIYEVHLGSWKKKGNEVFNYKESAHEIGAYCKKMGFSHVELMPILEHPLDESWGYQVTGFFAATSRYGTPEDFQYFVNYLHSLEIGVILDWVPAHFPTDEHSLTQFDGTYLYEHEDPRRGYHPHWNTAIFNYGRIEVANFLIASALFWCHKMHVDGLRVDAVASMLYLDYGREAGEWIPNIYGGNENLEAIEFIKHLNSIVHEQFPHVLTFAEESTSFPGVTHPLDQSGLGFDLKWNMGWMNDSLRYFQRDPLFRSHHQNDLTFALLYAFSERFLLPLSHDEVVHLKASLLSKMPGDDWQKFAQLRLLLSYQMCQPGKKLLFMGAELGMWNEWNCKEELPWDLLHYERHAMLQKFVKEMNHFYLRHQSLWEFDFDFRGFEWVDFSDCHNATISYLRKSTTQTLFCVHNFTPNFVPEYFIRLQNVSVVKEVFNSDRGEYYGSGKINQEVEIVYDVKEKPIGIRFILSPLATMIFEVNFV